MSYSISPTGYISPSSDPLINSMTTGYYWVLDSSRELDFSISDGFDGEFWTSPIDVAIYYAAALDTFSIYANINFDYLGYYTDPLASASWGSELNLSLSQTGGLFSSNNTWAMGFFPNSALNTTIYGGAPGDIFLNISSAANTLPSYEPGSQGWFLLLHEIGHTLGLKHPHDDGGTGRPTFSQLGIDWLDNDWATVMSYNDDGLWSDFFWDPATPMILDVLALQYLYGKNLNFNTGDNVYTLTETNFFYTLWDADGIDTLDASGTSGGWEIYLPEISISTLVDTKVGIAAPIGLSAQTLVWLAGNYENVIGSSFDDVIVGNQFDNIIRGGFGNDILDGGLGYDTLIGGAGDDLYIVDGEWSTTINEYRNQGIDTIESLVNTTLIYLENIENISLTGSNNLWATGNDLSNVLTGNSGHNALNGGLGDDRIFGNVGNDAIDGGLGIDTAQYQGTAAQYSFVHNMGTNTYNITDRVSNRDGVDTLSSIESLQFADQLVSLIPVFQSTGGTGGYTLPELFTGPPSLNLQYQLIETADNAVVIGSQFNDFIKVASANSVGKAVDAGAGADVIDGGVGSTFITGGSGGDTFFLDGRAPGTSWSTITDFAADSDMLTIWGFVRGVSSVDASFANFNTDGALGYQGLTFHFKNLLPSGQTEGSNPNLNSVTLSGRTLAEFGASSLAELNTQINSGTNANFLVGQTDDIFGTHGYLFIS
jgi:Ca2+-binding RTX toxin-like protein